MAVVFKCNFLLISGNGLLEDELGLIMLSLGGFIVLVIIVVWTWFCYRLCIVNKESEDSINQNDRARDKRMAFIRRQQAIQIDRRNTRRAIVSYRNKYQRNILIQNHAFSIIISLLYK